MQQLTQLKCTLSYYKGWDRKETAKSLETILSDSYAQDLIRQFTQYGAHQADLIVQSDDFKAKSHLSRGQQKIILFALKLAQAKLIAGTCLFLCDDLASELDPEHIGRLLELMLNSEGQYFITAISADSLFLDKQKMSYSSFSMQAGIPVFS